MLKLINRLLIEVPLVPYRIWGGAQRAFVPQSDGELAMTARLLVVVLGTATDGVWARIAKAAGLEATRKDLVEHYTADLRPRVVPLESFLTPVSFPARFC